MDVNDILNLLPKLTLAKVNKAELARALKIDPAALRRKELAKVELKISEIEKIEQHYKVNILDKNIKDCIDIPVRGEITASMGTGVEIYDENKTGTYQLGRKLLRDIGASQQFSEIIFAQGDSMEPTIEGGDSLLIDLSKTEIYDGKIYCVRIENKLYAKRLQLIPPNKVKVISDNKEKYDPFYIDISQNIDFDFAVIGEVKWWGRVAR